MISKTPVVSPGDVNVKVASHLSNLPAMLIDAFTSNLIVLCSGVISNTGACPRVTDGSTANATRLRMANRMKSFRTSSYPTNTLPSDEWRIQLSQFTGHCTESSTYESSS